jgi:hypothetical protein
MTIYIYINYIISKLIMSKNTHPTKATMADHIIKNIYIILSPDANDANDDLKASLKKLTEMSPNINKGKVIIKNETVHIDVYKKIQKFNDDTRKMLNTNASDTEDQGNCDTCSRSALLLQQLIQMYQEEMNLQTDKYDDKYHNELTVINTNYNRNNPDYDNILAKICNNTEVVAGTKECSMILSNIIQYYIELSSLLLTYIDLENVSTEITKVNTGGATMLGGGDDLGFANLISDSMHKSDGVYEGRKYTNKTSLNTIIHNKTIERNAIFKTLNGKIHDCYNIIITDLSKIGKKIGNEIPISEELRLFVNQLGYLSGVQPDKKNIHIALSGYRKDINSQYIKHDFIKSLESIVESSGHLIKYNDIKSLVSNINKLLSTIDNFNNNNVKALSEIHVDHKSIPNDNTSSKLDELIARGGMGMTELAMLEGDIVGGSDEFKYLSTMKKSIREIEYYYKISNIKFNLNAASSQHKDYTKNYDNILGEECAILISKINHTFKLLTCEDNSNNVDLKLKLDPNPVDPNPVDANVISSTEHPITTCIAYQRIYQNSAANDKKWHAYKFILEYIRSAKVDMIKAAQVMDLYLSKFTEKIQSNPDTVKDFLQLLEQLEIVAKWFTDRSGDNLVNVFESFPNGLSDIATPSGKKNTIGKDGTHYYEEKKTNTDFNLQLGIDITDIETVKEFIIRIEKSMKSMRALENIIATFTKFNYKLDIGPEMMAPGLIFKSFMKYTVATSLGINIIKDIPNSTDKVSFLDSLKNNNLKLHLRKVDKTIHDPLHIGNSADAESDQYLQTDDIFEMCIKSMVSKVFTTIGLYTLYNRPAMSYKSNDAIANTPLRQILGGASKPIIEPDAIELYVRLTLLGEWYRELFKFKNTDNKQNSDKIIISMIPAFDGIWDDFVNVIFVDAAQTTDGGYTESDSDSIIKSINKIYKYYKSKFSSDTCTKILNAFIAEVNMRYGLILQTEIDSYISEIKRGLDPTEYDSDNNVEYNILDTESSGKMAVPSDKFKTASYNSNPTTLYKKKFFNEIRTFRELIDTELTFDNKNSTENFGKLSLKHASVDDLIKQTKLRVKENENNDKKCEIVQNVIRGVERFSDINYDTMLMFHETVINPLTILYSVYKMMNHWNQFANSISITEAGINYIRQTKVNVPSDRFMVDDDIVAKYKPQGAGRVNDLMEDTINHLFYLTCDKNPMVEIQFSGTGNKRYPMLRFTKLEQYVTGLIACVAQSLDKFKLLLPYDIISKYESMNNEASLYSIKENLVDRLIKNKYGNGFDDANKSLKMIWLFLSKDKDHGDVLSKMIYWNANSLSKHAIKEQIDSSKLPKSFGLPPIPIPDKDNNPTNKTKPAGLGYNVYRYDDDVDDIKQGSYGIIFKFNRLIYHYISMFTDKSDDKIYLPLLHRFANGINAYEIMEGKSIDNFSPGGMQNANALFLEKEIKSNSSIFTSVAGAIKKIITEKSTGGIIQNHKLAHIELSDVSEYMKDLMAAYLPIFDKQLNIICSRCDLFKLLIENSNIKLHGDGGSLPGTEIQSKLSTGGILNDKIKSANESEYKSHLINMLSHISASARSLQNCCNTVYKELNDIPLYFETYKSSISDYKNRNNVLPLMPLSHVSHLLNNHIRINSGNINNTGQLNVQYYSRKGLIPHSEVGVGSAEFKFAYGTRGLLSDNNEPDIQFAPGVTGVLNTYNSLIGGGAHYDPKKMTECFNYSTHLLRYATDYMYHKTYLGDEDLNKLTKFYIKEDDGKNILQNLSCQTGRHASSDKLLSDGIKGTNDDFFINTTNITLLVENDNYKQSVYRMLKCIVTSISADETHFSDRKSLRIYNILDTNIVPINIHALQREIPLINIFNYSYTFDQLIEGKCGIEKSSKIYNKDETKYAEDALVKILKHPKGLRSDTMYNTNIWDLMAGKGLNLNKPKYLSDQLWNKVLLKSLYSKESRAGTGRVNRLNDTGYDSLHKTTGWMEPIQDINNVITYQNPKSSVDDDHRHKLDLVKLSLGNNAQKWHDASKERYDTILVRYIEWFVHCQRIMRLLMREQLDWVSDPIAHKSNAISKEITEYDSNKKFDLHDFE